MELTIQEKLDLINSMEIIFHDCDGEICWSVIVEDNEENRNKLHMIGNSDEDIRCKCHPNDGELDIVEIGFGVANWFDGEKFTIKDDIE